MMRNDLKRVLEFKWRSCNRPLMFAFLCMNLCDLIAKADTLVTYMNLSLPYSIRFPCVRNFRVWKIRMHIWFVVWYNLQGMHELLAPLIFVLHCDHQAFLHACELENVRYVAEWTSLLMYANDMLIYADV